MWTSFSRADTTLSTEIYPSFPLDISQSLTPTEKQKQKSGEAELLRFSKEKWLRFEFKHRGPREEGNKSYVVTLAKEFGQVSELHTLPFNINTHNPIAFSFFITV